MIAGPTMVEDSVAMICPQSKRPVTSDKWDEHRVAESALQCRIRDT